MREAAAAAPGAAAAKAMGLWAWDLLTTDCSMTTMLKIIEAATSVGVTLACTEGALDAG